jgi:hypothetical protein
LPPRLIQFCEQFRQLEREAWQHVISFEAARAAKSVFSNLMDILLNCSVRKKKGRWRQRPLLIAEFF